SKKAALLRYLSSVEGKNFMVTHLVSEIAKSYYELIALDNKLDRVNKMIEIQKNALKIVKQLKKAGEVTELAVRKFEAEVKKNKSHRYNIRQKITETENQINFLVGRFPQPIERNSQKFNKLNPGNTIDPGFPPQLLENRPDIKEAKLNLKAAKLDVKVAKARFYPSLRITADVGYQAFNPEFLLSTPESMLYSLAGDFIAPLINRKAIKTAYSNANLKQVQAVFNYQRTVLKAFTEVSSQLAKIKNLKKSYDLKSEQVATLNRSIEVSNALFQSARADYMEVLMTQRDALEAKIELIETKKEQLKSKVNVYQALGGGWK
ncbi:MAG: TolC family protein, partial [Flavobacteriales bacterium]